MNTLKRAFLILTALVLTVTVLFAAFGSGSGGADVPVVGKANNRGGGNDGKMAICHKTGDPANLYVELRLPGSAVRNGHGKHGGDIIPAPEGGCP